ncbi:hypothetical protein GAMM_40034 [Gammaproteobacteria bacterium]
MHLWIITFFSGICTLAFCRELPSLYWLFILPPIFFIWMFISQKIKKFITHVLVFVIGFCFVLIYTHWITAWNLPSKLEGKKLLITGYVTSLPIIKPYYIGFEFKTDSIASIKRAAKLKLSWYGQYPEKLHAGDKWQLLVQLKRPHGTLNPGGFDLEKYLLVHHIRATGYVVADDFNKILSSHWYRYPLTKLRQYLLVKMRVALHFDELTLSICIEI